MNKQLKHVPNIVLITLDAFNYNIALQNLNSLPTFKKLKECGVSFENAFSIGPNTFFAFPGIISSIYPYYFGVGIPREIETIASLLKRKGYHTALINEANALLTPYYGYHKGIDYQEHFLNLSHDKRDRKLKEVFLRKNKGSEVRITNGRISSLITNIGFKIQRITPLRKSLRAVYAPYKFFTLNVSNTTECYRERRILHEEFRAKIKWFISTKFKEPQFLWIHTIVNHLPYLPPDTKKFSEDEINHLNYIGLSRFMIKSNIHKLKKLYIESLKTTDRLLEFVINELDKNNFLQNTLVIITADHGEEFMENTNYYGHTPESSSDELLHIPLILYNLSDIIDINETRPNVLVSNMDILPTIADLVDIPEERINRICGQSLLPKIVHPEDNLQYSSRVLYSEAWQLNGLLDRVPGYLHDSAIFTVRYGEYKLKAIIERKNGYYTEKHISLSNWISNKELEIAEYYQEYLTLYYLLTKHLHEGYLFAKKVKQEYEMQKVRKHLSKIKV